MIKKNQLILGADCGGTNLKMALVDGKGRMIASDLQPMNYKQSPAGAMNDMAAKLKGFIAQHKVRAVSIKGLGIGIAGDVDPVKGLVRFSPNLGWKNVPLKAHLQKKLRLPITVDNDANCAALGAFYLDARGACQNLVCLTLGTGVGGGIIIRKKLYRGSTGSAGELGHMTIDYRGRRCGCGSLGCSESLVGAWGIIQTAKEAIAKNQAPRLNRLVREGSKLSPKLISQAAKAGDGYSKKLWEHTGFQLGCILANCVNIFNPDRIVLSGGVSKVGGLLLRPALATLRKRAFKVPVGKVKVTVSKYDEKLGVMGAAFLLLE